MRNIPLNRSLLTFLDELEYTEAALGADPETADLAPIFQQEIERWEVVFKRDREARRSVTRAEAVVSVRNGQLDDGTTVYGARTLGELGGDRKHPTFKRIFPAAPSELVRLPLRRQAEQTLSVMKRAVETLAEGHALRTAFTLVEQAAHAAIEALDARTNAKGARSSIVNDVLEWKEGVNAIRLSTYAELLRRAAKERGRGKAWARRFFRSESAQVAVDDEDEVQPEEPSKDE